MWEKELQTAIYSCHVASEKIMEVYRKGFDVEIKSDASPVTIADKTADTLIRQILKKEFPNYSLLTEESEDNLERLNNDYVWIVDPLDGTKDFVAKDGQFTTNIALAYKHRIVVGVVMVHATGELFYATEGGGAYRLFNGETTKITPNDKVDNLKLLVSNFHCTDKENEIISKYKEKIASVEGCGSSIKACKIAMGEAELSYRFMENTKEWDTAAPDIILNEAGGLFIQLDGKRITYSRIDVYNRTPYVMVNRKENILK